MDETENITFKIPREMKQELLAICKRKGNIPATSIVKGLISDYIEKEKKKLK